MTSAKKMLLIKQPINPDFDEPKLFFITPTNLYVPIMQLNQIQIESLKTNLVNATYLSELLMLASENTANNRLTLKELAPLIEHLYIQLDDMCGTFRAPNKT